MAIMADDLFHQKDHEPLKTRLLERWVSEIKKIARTNWQLVAMDRGKWKEIVEASSSRQKQAKGEDSFESWFSMGTPLYPADEKEEWDWAMLVIEQFISFREVSHRSAKITASWCYE